MIPFRVFDQSEKIMWTVLNYQAASNMYLVAKDDESHSDNNLKLMTPEEITQFHFIDVIFGNDKE